MAGLSIFRSVFMAGIFCIAMGANGTTSITIKGSDTMVILAQRWAEAFMAAHPDVSIQVTGGGSGTGISALINGTTDICNASRPMKAAERDKLKQRYQSLGVEVKSARDGLAVYLPESSPITELTLDQVKGIYTGKIKNWKEVGGPDQAIILYGRENNSGTYVYFRDNVLGGQDFSATMQSMPGTAAVVNAVAKDTKGIGFGGAAYAKGVKFVKIKLSPTEAGYEPSLENIKAGKYPITRYLYMYLKSQPSGEVKQYVDWVLSEDGQAIVSKVGYFPIR